MGNNLTELVSELKSETSSIYYRTEKIIIDKINSTDMYFDLKAKNETVAEEYRSNKVALYKQYHIENEEKYSKINNIIEKIEIAEKKSNRFWAKFMIIYGIVALAVLAMIIIFYS